MEKIQDLFAKAEIQFWKLVIRLMKDQNLLHWPPTARIITILAGILALAGFVFFSIHVIAQSSSSDQVALRIALQKKVTNNRIPGKNSADSSLNQDQTNLLIILVDSLGKDQPDLKGVWLAGHVASIPQVVFFPLYPSIREDETRHYESLFGLAAGQEPAEQFFKFLRAKEISWTYYLVLDETSLVELFSLVNRDSIESQTSISPALDMTVLNDPKTSEMKVKAQARLASSLCVSVPELIRNADPVIIWNLLTHRMRSDIELQTIESARQALAQPGETPVCEFPTLRELTFNTENP